MVTVTLGLTLKTEAVDAFCADMAEAIKDTAKFPGFRAIRILRHKDDPAKVMLIEDWDSEDAYDSYIAWRTQRGDIDSLSEVMATPPMLDIWPTLAAAA
jgi:quinol monooxygenase YgiN